MEIREHWLAGCRQLKSPNCNDRPFDTNISLLVIHGISLPPGQYGGPYIDQLFCNSLSPTEHPYFKNICHLEVSSHLLIQRDGQVTQYVPFNKRAWHAGLSRYEDRENCNDFSIGLELEGEDDTPYEIAQYQQLAKVSALLMATYPSIRHHREVNQKIETMTHSRIDAAHIVGHCDIAPGRKTDPGPSFDWDYYQELMA